LEEVVDALDVRVGIITVPEIAAADTYHKLLKAGVKGILNFSPVTLKPVLLKDGSMSVVQNINLSLSLEKIFYELKFPRKQKPTD
jgi:redox-sensing transcriptional repressor